MVVLSNTTAQTLTPGQSLTFDTLKQTGCSEYVSGTGASQVFLKENGLYLVDFSANIGGPTAATPVQLQLEVNGGPQPETLRISVPAAATTDLNAVSFATAVSTAANCCFDLGSVSLTITNTGANSVIVGVGSSFRIIRVG